MSFLVILAKVDTNFLGDFFFRSYSAIKLYEQIALGTGKVDWEKVCQRDSTLFDVAAH